MKINDEFTFKDILLACLILVIIWAFSTKSCEQFAKEFSFAATISSIILSMIAIFISIAAESRTENLREKIEKEADGISDVKRDMQEILNKIDKKIDDVKEEQKRFRAYMANSGKQNFTVDEAVCPPNGIQNSQGILVGQGKVLIKGEGLGENSND